MFKVLELTLDLIAQLRPVAVRIRKHDRSLANQLCRAATSVALNLAEGNYSDPGTARARFSTAAGSASETQTALRVALAWGYVNEEQLGECFLLVDRILAMLWKLTRKRS